MARRPQLSKKFNKEVYDLPGPVDLRPWRTIQPAPVPPTIPIEVIRAAVESVIRERKKQ